MTCLYLKEYPLKVSNKRTHIPLLINLSIFLIKLEHQLKTLNKSKIDKITYSKCSLEKSMMSAKISL